MEEARAAVQEQPVAHAHLIRDFCCFAERGGAGGEIGEQLLKRAAIMFRWWHLIRDGTLTRRTFQRRMKPVERPVGRLLRRAAACGDAKIEGMAKEILKHEPALFTFVYADADVGLELMMLVPDDVVGQFLANGADV